MIHSFPSVAVDAHVTRRVLADSPELMVVAFDFREGGVGAPYHHPHIQSTYCESGHFRFHVGEREFEVGPGDSFVIPSDMVHGCTCLEGGRLVDSFAPRRDDFL